MRLTTLLLMCITSINAQSQVFSASEMLTLLKADNGEFDTYVTKKDFIKTVDDYTSTVYLLNEVLFLPSPGRPYFFS